MAEEEVRGLLESLYLGPSRLIRAAVPHMRKRRFGIVVNFSSGAALEGRDSMGAYAGAKAATDGKCQLPMLISVPLLMIPSDVQGPSKGSRAFQYPHSDCRTWDLQYQFW